MAKDKTPGHYTDKGTRKFQANGPIEWSRVFLAAAGKDGREGEGIRLAMGFAVANREQFLEWAKGARAAAVDPAQLAIPSKAPKSKAPKAPKAPKSRASKSKAPKGDA